jgi:acyl-coenzyme A thioesterase PaaI-like protein
MVMRKSNLHLLSKMGFLSESRRFSWWPPFWMMRVKVLELAKNWTHVRIKLPLTWISANAAGNMFGGFQANLADPVPAIACVKLFPGYRVATKKLEIDFLRVGNSDLVLHFDFSDEKIKQIQQELEEHGRTTPCFEMTYVRDDGEICACIKNTIAIRPRGYVGNHDRKVEES